MIGIMIEKENAVAELDRVLQCKGVDLIQFGPNDFAMSTGRPGEAMSPAVKEVERTVIRTCLAAGVAVRAEIASVEAAGYYLDLGVRHFSLYHDLQLMHSAWRDGGQRLREVIGDG